MAVLLAADQGEDVVAEGAVADRPEDEASVVAFLGDVESAEERDGGAGGGEALHRFDGVGVKGRLDLDAGFGEGVRDDAVDHHRPVREDQGVGGAVGQRDGFHAGQRVGR
nr:hypothetical protein [Streptomyces coryli]